jgi:hypothetical protein
MVCRRRIVQNVASLEELASGDEKVELAMSLNTEVQSTLMRNCNDPFAPIPYTVVQRSQLRGILDAVRTAVLNWSLKLETDGIVGDGMSFSLKEKTIASEKAADLQPVINYITIGHMENSSIQQGTQQSRQQETS